MKLAKHIKLSNVSKILSSCLQFFIYFLDDPLAMSWKISRHEFMHHCVTSVMQGVDNSLVTETSCTDTYHRVDRLRSMYGLLRYVMEFNAQGRMQSHVASCRHVLLEGVFG